MFSSELFFQSLKFIKGAKKTINKISKYTDISILTIGTAKNLSLKNKWIKRKFLFKHINFIGLEKDFNANDYNKSSINMSNGIIIDDRIDVLQSTNAPIKILFKNYQDYSWQKVDVVDNVYIVNSWDEIYEIVMFYVEHGII